MNKARQTSSKEAVPSQFSAHEVLDKMVAYFRYSINQKAGMLFSGNKAVEILLEYFELAKDDFPQKNLTQRSAILVLERFFCWKVIGSTMAKTNFVDCAKNIYFLLPEDEFIYARKKPSTDSETQRTPSSSPSRMKRDGSLKRFFNRFSIGASARKRLVFEDDDNTAQNKTGLSDVRVTAQDATLYKAALQSILVLLDVSDLDGIANQETADSTSKSDVSFLTSIFSHMGISSARSHRTQSCSSNDEKTDNALAENGYAQHMLKFFTVARLLVPSIQLRSVMPYCPKEECSIWASQCVACVAAWLKDLTHNGATPIIPVEFANICSAIVDQVFCCDRAWHNENRVLQCLVLLIPLAMRRHLRLLLQWMSESRRMEDIRIGFAPSKLPHEPESTLCENTRSIIHRIVDFLIPKSIGRQRQQVLAHALIELCEAGHFDEVPLDIQAVIENQQPGEEPTVMTFCQRQDEKIDSDEFTKLELIKMMRMLLESSALTAVEKSERLEAFRKAHPELYVQHFATVTFDSAVTSRT